MNQTIFTPVKTNRHVFILRWEWKQTRSVDDISTDIGIEVSCLFSIRCRCKSYAYIFNSQQGYSIKSEWKTSLVDGYRSIKLGVRLLSHPVVIDLTAGNTAASHGLAILWPSTAYRHVALTYEVCRKSNGTEHVFRYERHFPQ